MLLVSHILGLFLMAVNGQGVDGVRPLKPAGHIVRNVGAGDLPDQRPRRYANRTTPGTAMPDPVMIDSAMLDSSRRAHAVNPLPLSTVQASAKT